jgi:hypothetical protein
MKVLETKITPDFIELNRRALDLGLKLAQEYQG